MAEPILVELLRMALKAAMTERDRTAMAALRSAIAAVDNATAVDATAVQPTAAGPIAKAVAGVGASEVPRRRLTDLEFRAIVQGEAIERREASAYYERVGRSDTAVRLQAEASSIESVLMAAINQPDEAP